MTVSRRNFLIAALSAAAAPALAFREAAAFGTEAVLEMPLLRYDSPSWNARPTALRRMLLEVDLRTNIRVGTGEVIVRPTMEDLFQSPMLVMGGAHSFSPFAREERDAIRRFVNAGGFWLIDSSDTRLEGGFDASVRRELEAIFPGSSLGRLPSEHVVYQTFFLLSGAPGRLDHVSYIEGISIDGRLAVLYSRNDLMGAWARDRFGNFEHSMHGGERRREAAYRFGVNLAMLVLTLDYKEDQVHIPHILRRRRWRVD